MSVYVLRCKYCDRISSNRCSRCLKVSYCTKICQTLDWPSHKVGCFKHSYNESETNANLTSQGVKQELDVTVRKDHVTSAKKGNHEKTGCSESDMVEGVLESLSLSPDTDEIQLKKDKEMSSLKTQGVRTIPIDDILKENTDNKKDCQSEECKSHRTVLNNIENDTSATNILDETQSSNDCKSNNATKGESIRNQCGFCKISGCLKTCSRCKETFYCSAECQRQDWTQHKTRCKKALSEEDERILKCWKEKQEQNAAMAAMAEKEKSAHPPDYSFGFQTYIGPRERFYKTLTREQALFRLNPPEGSLEKAIRMTKSYFPDFKVVTAFDDIPDEYLHSLFNLLDSWNDKYVLVAFMYRYHAHVMRHGVYLKDEHGKESKVEFYLDDFGDNPFPYFSYSQVKPGGYICLVAPVMHEFKDGTIGIRIDLPEQVRVLHIDDVMRTSVEH